MGPINRRTILIIIGVLIVILALGMAIWVWRSRSSQPNSTSNTASDLFPSGSSRSVPTSNPPVNLNANNQPVANGSTATITPAISGNQPVNPLSLLSGQFKNIVSAPVASAFIFPTTTNTIDYLDQASGNLYQTSLIGSASRRLSLTTINGVRSVIWGGNASNPKLIIGTNSPTGLVFSASSLPTASSAPGDLVSSTTPGGYYAFAISPNGQQIFALTRINGRVSGVLTDFNFSKPVKIVDLDFGDWQLAWPSANLIVLTTRASAIFPGSVYFLNPSAKSLTKTLGGINGLLTVVSPSGNWLIYSGLESGQLVTYLKNLKTNNLTLLPVATLADKCVWTSDSVKIYCAVPSSLPASQYPDNWFKGIISLNDNFWQINIASTTNKIIADTGKLGVFDAVNLFLDNTNETLFFTNKKDLGLWGLDVREGF